MSQLSYKKQQPSFGKLQGSIPAPRQRSHSGAQSVAAHAFQQHPQYAEIVGNGDTANTAYNDTSFARPVKGLRFLSGIIDFCIVSCIGGLILTVMFGVGAGIEDMLNGGIVKYYTWFAIACFIYGASMEASPLQGTVGKLVTGTVVVDEGGETMSFGQVVGRNLGKILTYVVPFGIGYFMVLFTRKNQSLHDKMAGTVVYRKGQVPQSYSQTFA